MGIPGEYPVSWWAQKPVRRELQLIGVISYGWNNPSYTFIFGRRVITPFRTGSGAHLVVLDGIFFCSLRILGIDTVPNSFDLKLWYEKSFLPEVSWPIPSKLAFWGPLLYRFKPFHWRVQWSLGYHIFSLKTIDKELDEMAHKSMQLASLFRPCSQL